MLSNRPTTVPPGLQPANRTISPDQNRRQVPAVAVGKTVRPSVIDSQKKRGIFFRRSAFIKLVIEQAEQRSRRNSTPSGHAAMILPEPATRAHADRLPHLGQTLHTIGANRRVDRRHQECGGNSLPADVAHRQNQLVRACGQKIVIVSADRARGPAESMNLERFEF